MHQSYIIYFVILVLLWFGGVACYLQSAGNTEYNIHYNSSTLNPITTEESRFTNRALAGNYLVFLGTIYRTTIKKPINTSEEHT